MYLLYRGKDGSNVGVCIWWQDDWSAVKADCAFILTDAGTMAKGKPRVNSTQAIRHGKIRIRQMSRMVSSDVLDKGVRRVD